ncbi:MULTISPECIES: SDR family NAD(P)-dependent oxidoreductase [Cellulophaga]|uniref:SDR family NAD(P)-dependent oxidoreductase n=1 Tax=Cellulophaga TaxID=104264 RepID=UPI002091A456|nr:MULTISPECIES: SDR family NAD(P)-dependent oxidoreductase [Cellulophaga]MDO6769520.1 SDR family NAD(P)-dependent oxidoreductase [Cellulophaga sp. 1_MG-2023]
MKKKSEKVWFITGTSRGFGRIWTEAALERGDKVAATARSLESIADLKEKYGEHVLLLKLDVTKPIEAKAAIEEAYKHFGRLDVVFNNAGYSLVGTIEEASIAKIRELYETNILGAVSVIQAALPLLRAQGHGHIIGTSSSLGFVTYPIIGFYCSSKWAFEAIHESLAAEVKQFGIKVTIIEPGAYATEFGTLESLKFANKLEVYDNLKNQIMERLKTQERGNPKATPKAILKVVDVEEPPLRLFLGTKSLPEVKNAFAARIKEWEAWESVSNAVQG